MLIIIVLTLNIEITTDNKLLNIIIVKLIFVNAALIKSALKTK